MKLKNLSCDWANYDVNFNVITLSKFCSHLLLCITISDLTLTTDSVAEVMELVDDWNSLLYNYNFVEYDRSNKGVIHNDRLREIQQRCSTEREIANECASYYVHYHPQASWTHLASCLYRKGEFVAVEKLKPFLPLRG